MDEVEDRKRLALARFAELPKEVSGMAECKTLHRKMHGSLLRRIKLLSPLFEELEDSNGGIDAIEIQSLEALLDALDSALELLKSVATGSKLYQALRSKEIAESFHQMNERIEVALREISFRKLSLPEEVAEQIELVHAQFRRATEAAEPSDAELARDLSIARREKSVDPATLSRLSEKLHLITIDEVNKETEALLELAASSETPGDLMEEMKSLLVELKNQTEKRDLGFSNAESGMVTMNHRSPVILDEFRCPISLELMMDPVIVSTGQTYERSCIQKWLDAGHKTCPKTQQTLLHSALTPNYVLKSLIAMWCESNGVDPPRSRGSYKNRGGSDCDEASLQALLRKLESKNVEHQRAATGELRLLAKRNADNRVRIAEAGAIPLLVELLSSLDSRTQEHAVTALLNLSINDTNKGIIVKSGAIREIVQVLVIGSMEARENAAATLFSLSVVDDNKVTIGALGAIPALVRLLCEGTPRGKKDAATAIFNLSMYQVNKARAVRAGIVGPLMGLVMDAGGGMVDEALAILSILAIHLEGREAIAASNAVPAMLEFVRTGSPRNRENAAAVLWAVCAGYPGQVRVARELGGEEALRELLESGTDRAKRKAGSTLALMQRPDFA